MRANFGDFGTFKSDTGLRNIFMDFQDFLTKWRLGAKWGKG